jgi:hypothetical protein
MAAKPKGRHYIAIRTGSRHTATINKQLASRNAREKIEITRFRH